MRRFTLLIALIAMASFTFAQHHVDYAPVKSSQKFQKQTSTTKAAGDVIWSVDFEEATPVWTFGHDDGPTMWFVGDQDAAPTVWEPSPGSFYFEYLGEYSETGNTEEGDADGSWAMIDILSAAGDFGGPGQVTENSWIQFDGIDLTGVASPKLTFYQLYRPLNSVASYIDFSIDGGSTWTEVEVNTTIGGNEYGDLVMEMLVGNYIGNQGNVSIRFRWLTSDASSIVGYGWQIDDIKIVENAEYDLKLVDARMNFFNFIDYTEPGNEDYFHYTSHYGQIPNEQLENEMAVMWFNVMVENNGMYDASPSVNVIVIDPLGTEVYNETVVGDVIAISETDTVDVLEVEFLLPVGLELGEYTVLYEIFEEGMTDYNEDNNVYAVTFNATDNIYGRDCGDISSQAGPGNWLSGGNDGDMIGTTYLFLYDTEITSMWIYIGDNTTEGVMVVAHVLEFSDADDAWVDMATSSLYTIGADDIDGWVEFTFPDPIVIELGDEDAFQVLAAVEFYYNGGEGFVGTDDSAPSSFWSGMWFFTDGDNAGSFFSITNWAPSNLGIRLQTTATEETIAMFSADDTEIYEGEMVTFMDESSNADQWEWTFEGGDPATSTEQNPVVTYNTAGMFDVTLTVTNSVNSATDTRTVEEYITIMPTHISATANVEFNVYPNPATDVVTIETSQITRLRVMNSIGQIVFESNDNTVNTFDVSSWNSGWYILEVNTGEEVIRTNIIVE